MIERTDENIKAAVIRVGKGLEYMLEVSEMRDDEITDNDYDKVLMEILGETREEIYASFQMFLSQLDDIMLSLKLIPLSVILQGYVRNVNRNIRCDWDNDRRKEDLLNELEANLQAKLAEFEQSQNNPPSTGMYL